MKNFYFHWATKTGLYTDSFTEEQIKAIRLEALVMNQKFRTGKEIWQRHAEADIFSVDSQIMNLVKTEFLTRLQDFCDPYKIKIAQISGAEIVRYHGQEINEHTDREDGHISAHLFLDGDPLSETLTTEDLNLKVNQNCENAMVLSDPATRDREMRLPWESPQCLYIKPHKGLWVFFLSRLPHYQKPYLGNMEFVQLSITARFKLKSGLRWDLEDSAKVTSN